MFRISRPLLTALSFVTIPVYSLFAQHAAQKSILINNIAELKATEINQSVKITPVTGRLFSEALHVVTGKALSSNLIINLKLDSAVKKGDILWLTFQVRCIDSKRETGEAFIDFILNRKIKGIRQWPPLFERGISVGKQWQLNQIPFVAAMDVNAGDLNFEINCGNVSQTFELGDLQLVNYHRTSSFNSLPRTKVRYDGDAPDASWRIAAKKRIDKYRKGGITIKLVDKGGKPVGGALVKMAQISHSYSWGSASNAAILIDSVNQESFNYRDTLIKHFNAVVIENEMKWKNWDKFDHQKTINALKWLNEHHFKTRGHVLVWPSWRNSPGFLSNLKSDTATLRLTILNNIKTQAGLFKNYLSEWDVVNEPFANHDLLDILGKREMVEWFKEAHKDAPLVKLFLNDFTMFQGSDPGSPSEDFYDNVKYLIDNGAPIEAIGEQGHIGGSPPGMDYIVNRLNHFAKLGLPIQISEFDVTSDDDDFKARYTRDFMTAVFSVPATIGIVQWGFWAKQHWIPSAALWNDNWQINPNGKAFTNLVSKVWVTNTAGKTSKNGLYTLRGFKGKYNLTIQKGKQVYFKQFYIGDKKSQVTFKLIAKGS